jgi:hypothetical protein
MIADPHCPNAMGVGWAECSVTVTKQVMRRFVPRKGVSHLAGESAASSVHPLLSVPRGSISCFFRLLLASESTVISVAVPPLTLEVINAARKIEPDDNIFWAMLLSLLLGWIESQTPRGIGEIATSTRYGKQKSE